MLPQLAQFLVQQRARSPLRTHTSTQGLSLAQLHAQVAAALDLCELRELVAAAERRGLVRVAAAHWALCAPGDVPLLPGATPWFAAAPAARDA